MNRSDQAAVHLEMMLQRYEDQLHLLDRQGRAYNVGARRFLQRRLQYITDQISHNMPQDVVSPAPSVTRSPVNHADQGSAILNH